MSATRGTGGSGHEGVPPRPSATADLPRRVEPRRDLWPGIEARLDDRTATREAGAAEAEESPRVVHVSFFRTRAGAIALAAAAVALLFAATLWQERARDAGIVHGDAPGGAADSVPAELAAAAEFPPAELAAGSLEAASADALRDVLGGLDAADLDPETVEVLRRNLEVIDGAIEEIRRALDEDPDHRGRNRLLHAEMRRRGEVLRRAADLTRSI